MKLKENLSLLGNFSKKINVEFYDAKKELDETYIGNLVQYRATSVSYKNHKKIKNNKKDWIVVENIHEAIIDKNTFYQAQEKLKTRKRSEKNGKVHPLANKMFCECCGSVFL